MHLTIFATTKKYASNLSDELETFKTDNNFSKLKRCDETPLKIILKKLNNED